MRPQRHRPDIKGNISLYVMSLDWSLSQCSWQSLDSSLEEGPGDDFLDMLMKAQGGRMDDQRCELPRNGRRNPENQTNTSLDSRPPTQSNNLQPNDSLQPPSEMKPSVSTENLFDILQRVQGSRIDEQRFSMPPLPGLDPARMFLSQEISYLILFALHLVQ